MRRSYWQGRGRDPRAAARAAMAPEEVPTKRVSAAPSRAPPNVRHIPSYTLRPNAGCHHSVSASCAAESYPNPCILADHVARGSAPGDVRTEARGNVLEVGGGLGAMRRVGSTRVQKRVPTRALPGLAEIGIGPPQKFSVKPPKRGTPVSGPGIGVPPS